MKYFLMMLFLFMLANSCQHKEHNDSAHTKSSEDTYYTCSMHPQIIEKKMGKCPICHMDLVPVKKDKNNNENTIQLSDQQIQLGNIKVDTVKTGNITDRIVTTGILNFDQDKKNTISSRVTGRIEKLYYKNVGDYVPKGAPIFEMYSEELNNAKQEYLLALEKQETFGNTAAINFQKLLQSARNKLLLWGMTEVQINQLASQKKINPLTTFYSTSSGYIVSVDAIEGSYAMDGQTILNLDGLSTLWAEAQVYTSQMSNINLGSIATVKIPDMDNMEINGRISFVNPEVKPSTRINLIRVTIPNKENLLKPGMPVYVFFQNSKNQSITLPTDAVLRDGKMATIWLQVGKGKFLNKMVKTGLESDGKIEILSGIDNGDIVVTAGAYLLNSEFIFKNGANPMAGHRHKMEDM